MWKGIFRKQQEKKPTMVRIFLCDQKRGETEHGETKLHMKDPWEISWILFLIQVPEPTVEETAR